MYILVLILAIPIGSYTASAALFSDVSGHWSQSYIDWGVSQSLAKGYEDGSFRPDDYITEIEFLALMLRAYGSVTRADELPSDWGRSYYKFADDRGWPLAFDNGRGNFRRGQAALLIATAAKGTAFNENGAVQWLLDNGLSRGRTSATIAGYEAAGRVTRAEALTFIYTMKEKVAAVATASLPKQTSGSLRGVSLGDKTGELLYRLGQPSRIEAGDYDYEWHVYAKSYNEYAMYGVKGGSVSALFSNDAGSWSNTGGINVDGKLSAVLSSIPSAAKSSAKQDDHYYEYGSNGNRHVLFLDGQEGKRIAGMLIQLQSLTARQSAALGEKERTAMEQQLFDLVNAERAQRGIGTLQWDALAGSTARAHSVDMMKKNYFDHTNLSGKSPFDRMKSAGIKYSMASENIAAGYANGLFAHYALLNSPGHRKSILDGKLTRLGTGVAFGGKYNVYFTQNYYTP
jgi:uncharacterized protein YkwD